MTIQFVSREHHEALKMKVKELTDATEAYVARTEDRRKHDLIHDEAVAHPNHVFSESCAACVTYAAGMRVRRALDALKSNEPDWSHDDDVRRFGTEGVLEDPVRKMEKALIERLNFYNHPVSGTTGVPHEVMRAAQELGFALQQKEKK